jgi:glutaredoxin
MSGSSAEKSENPLATDLSALFPDVGGRQTTCRHYFRTPGSRRDLAATRLAGMAPPTPVTVTLLVRSTCGSCVRVREQITPLCADLEADLEVVDVDGETSLTVEFGDRVPVVLVDDEEVACWEIDDEELVAAVTAARAS